MPDKPKRRRWVKPGVDGMTWRDCPIITVSVAFCPDCADGCDHCDGERFYDQHDKRGNRKSILHPLDYLNDADGRVRHYGCSCCKAILSAVVERGEVFRE